MKKKLNIKKFKFLLDELIPESKAEKMPKFSSSVNIKKFTQKILPSKKNKIIRLINKINSSNKKQKENSNELIDFEKIIELDLLEAYFTSKKVKKRLKIIDNKLKFKNENKIGKLIHKKLNNQHRINFKNI